MRRARISLLLIVALIATIPSAARAQVPGACVDTPRPPASPVSQAQEASFGLHDEELVICSPGWEGGGVHLAARLFVPAGCPGVGGCAGVVIAHGFGFSKEITLPDMYAAAQAGLYVLSYDVRGQGASGGQAAFLGRDDIADQAAILRWWHEQVRPTKTAVYGISQGGWLAWTAGVFNCGAGRSARFDSSVPCDAGGRWVDAIVPVQSPMGYLDDGTCSWFDAQVAVETRLNPSIVQGMASCPTEGSRGRVPGILLDVAHRLGRIDVPVYAVTSFYDRVVPPRLVTNAYRTLHRRTLNRRDALYGTDVRLTISNDAHGDVGGNLAVVNDLIGWMRHHLAGGPPLRAAKVAIAQEWAEGAFRLERDWPVPGSRARSWYLARDAEGTLASRPSGEPDELRNLPTVSSAPDVPGVGFLVPSVQTTEVPGARLVFQTEPFARTAEVTGEPVATIFVSSSNADSAGKGQLNLGLAEIAPDGSVQEFSHARIGLADLGPKPRAVRVPLSIAGHRVDAGSRLMLTITSSDVADAMPAPGVDPFFVHHDARTPSRIAVPFAPIDRRPPAGEPPMGAAYTSDPIGAICAVFGLPC